MKALAKYILLCIVGISLSMVAAILLKPSMVLNRALLVDSLNGVESISYKEIDLEVLSPALLDREMKFAARDLCVKNDKIDLCLGKVAIDVVLTLGTDGLRITKVERFLVNDSWFALNIPQTDGKEEHQAAAQKIEEWDDAPKIKKGSLLLRALELFSGLSIGDMHDIDIKNFSYHIHVKDKDFRGKVDVKKSEDALALIVDNSYRGEETGVRADFGDDVSVAVTSAGRPVAEIKIYADPLKEFFEYIKSKELYRYRKKELRGRVEIKDIKKIQKLVSSLRRQGSHGRNEIPASAGMTGQLSEPDLSGHIICDAELAMNSPDSGEAFLSLGLSGDITDGGNSVSFAGEVIYDFYQKIPFVRIDKLEAPHGDYYSMELLTKLLAKLDMQLEYQDGEGAPEITIKRDYSKLPRRLY